jgi:hypothetical protein
VPVGNLVHQDLRHELERTLSGHFD